LAADEQTQRRSWPQRAYLWACDRLYHELAGSYDPISWLVSLGGWDSWRRLALDDVQGHVLELGYGTGALLATLAAAGRPVVGLELSPAMQQVAARRFARAGVQPPQVRADAAALPLAAASFNTVLATFPAPYILAPATLAECRRVLKPGGRLVVVGMWARAPRRSPLRLIPMFYGSPTPAQTARLLDHFSAAGFTARLEWRAAPRGEVAVLVATPGIGGTQNRIHSRRRPIRLHSCHS
jgi:ubiquinone/menaquinone biosynthesis C-methylase UbiE